LYSIAKKYDVPLEEIVKANPDISNPDIIEPGMKVKIPSHSKTPLGVIHQHIVQQGDTLWKLSKAWGVQLTDLIKANPQLKNPNALLTGEVVNIPKTDPNPAVPGPSMHSNKANTGVKAETGKKEETAVMPQPTPLPVANKPAPVAPIQEAKPIYGLKVHEQVEIVHQYPVQTVHEHHVHEHHVHEHHHGMPLVGAESMHPGHGYGGYACENEEPLVAGQSTFPGHGYGMNQPLVGGESTFPGHGYGMNQPLVGGESTFPGHGYGMNQPLVGGESTFPGHGYGVNQPLVGGESTFPGHGYGMNQPLVGGVSAFPGHGYGMNQPLVGGESTFPGHGYGMNQPLVGGVSAFPGHGVPANIAPLGGEVAGKMTGCKTCGGKTSAVPSNVNAGVAPFAEAFPGTGYSGPYPMSPYGTSPYTGYPGYPGSDPMGDPPVYQSGFQPGFQPGYQPGFQPGFQPGYQPGVQPGVQPGFQPGAFGMPGAGGFEPGYGYPEYGGGIPTIPSMPPMPPLREDGSDLRSDGEVEAPAKTPATKKRQAKPKGKPAQARVNKPRRKESMPWIKW